MVSILVEQQPDLDYTLFDAMVLKAAAECGVDSRTYDLATRETPESNQVMSITVLEQTCMTTVATGSDEISTIQ